MHVLSVTLTGIMHAVILAAGRGTRMGHLTDTTPKPLLRVASKTLLEHKIELLPDTITDVHIVVGYQGNLIENHLGTTHQGRALHYHQQHELNGTAGALWLLKDILTETFLVMMGDDLYAPEDIAQACTYPWAYLVQEHLETVSCSKGNTLVDMNGNLTDIDVAGVIEAPQRTTAGLYVLQPDVFQYRLVPKAPGSSEYGLPHTLVSVAKDFDIPVLPATNWLQITTPEDLLRAEQWLMHTQNNQ